MFDPMFRGCEYVERLRLEARTVAILRRPNKSLRARFARLLLAIAQRCEPELLEVRLETRPIV